MNKLVVGAFALLFVFGCDVRDGIPIGEVDGGTGGSGGTASCGVVCDSFDLDEISAVCDQFCSPVVCTIGGVEECFPPVFECEECADPEAVIRALIANYERGYADGFSDGVESVVCECEDDDEDECNRAVPPGHLRKECRGRPDKG